jgi:hypothetical protein
MDTTTRRALQALVQHQITESAYAKERKDLWHLYHLMESLERENAKPSGDSAKSFFALFAPHLSVLGMCFLGIVVAVFMLGNL